MFRSVKELLFSILTLFVLCSCPVTPPVVPPSALNPHQQPDMPQNVNVISGLNNRIRISWDRVANADSYQVWFSEAGNPSSKENTLLQHNVTVPSAIVDLSSSFAPVIDSGKSYDFYVVAYRSFNGKGYYSEPSDQVEGAIAPHPEDIYHHGYIKDTEVNIYWNCPTVFSVYDDSRTLYTSDFTLQYSEDDGITWIDAERDPGTEDPYLYHVMDLNQWPQGTVIQFRILMQITASDGSTVTTITSDQFSMLISNDMTPSPVENVRFTQGNSASSIKLSWTIPLWTGGEVNRENSFFKIERAESGTDDYEVLVDEIGNMSCSDSILESDGEFVFSDTSAEVGKSYDYRILNAAVDTENMLCYSQNETDAYVITNAYLYQGPVINDDISATVSGNLSNSAEISFSWDYENAIPSDLEWKIERTVIHPDEGEKEEKSFIDVQISLSGEDSYHAEISSYQESLSCMDCFDTRHEYVYRSVLVFSDGGEIFASAEDYPAFKIIGVQDYVSPDDSTHLILDSKNLISDLKVVERINKLELNWVADEQALNSEYFFIIDDGEQQPLTNVISGEDGKCQSVITMDDSSHHKITLVGAADGGYRNILVQDDVNAIGFRSDFTLTASAGNTQSYIDRISVSWAGPYDENDGIIYTLQVAEDGSENWSDLTEIQMDKLSYDVTSLDISKDYHFRIKLSDENHTEDGPVFSSAAYGEFAKVADIAASKGIAGKIEITWNEIENAQSYNVYRFDANADDADPVKFTSSSNSFIDTTSGDNPVIAGKKYIYLVTAVYNNDETAFADNPASASVSNQFEIEEAGNLGYVYRDIEVEDFSVTESFETENTLLPYFKITFRMDETNSVYKITAQNDTAGIIVKLSDLADRNGNIWTNGLAEDQSGYISLDTESLMAVVNADIGVIDIESQNFTSDFSIAEFSIQAWQSEDSIESTTVRTINEKHYKALGPYDYLYLANTALSLEIGNAESSFGNDWWGGGDTIFGIETGDPKTYSNQDNHISIVSCSSSNGSAVMNSGMITLDEYKFDSSLISGNLSILARHEDVISGGYLDDDPLERIGTDDNNSISLTVRKNVNLGSKIIAYNSTAYVFYNNVYVDSTAGNYSILISDEKFDIELNDLKNIQNIGVGL